MSARDIKIKPIVIVLDKPRNLVFDLNAFEVLEEIYEDLDTAFKSFQDDKRKIKHIKNFLYAGLVHEDEDLSPELVGKMIGYTNLNDITDQIWMAITQNLPEPKEGSEGNEGE